MMTRSLALATAFLMLGSTALSAEVRGTIVRVDVQHKQVEVEVRSRGLRGQTVSIQIDGKTAIHFSRDAGQLSDLAAGQRVHVVYESRDGQRVAVSFNVRGGRPATAPPAATATANGVAGTLRHVDYTEREIIIVAPDPKSKDEKQIAVLVPESAKITKSDKALKFDDLKEGESVAVQFQMRDGKRTASAIEVGATTVKAASSPNSSRVERLRRVLQLVDALLQMADGMQEMQEQRK